MLIPIITATAVVLGVAFDYSSLSAKNLYIYNTKAIEETKLVIERPFTQSQYRIMEYSSETNDFLDIDGDLSLKAKKEKLKLKGIGEYMKQQIDREKTIEILISVYHEEVTETFPSYTEMNTDWKDLSPSRAGSHYISSITYGGQLVITYLLKAKSSEYLEEIKAAVTGNMALSGSFDGSLKGNIDKMNKEVQDKVSIEIHAFATAGIFAPPRTLEDVFKLVEDYPSLVKQINGGKGSPMKMGLVPLGAIDPKFKTLIKNRALDSLLNEAINKFDDIRSSYDEFSNWQKSLDGIDDDQQELVDVYYGNIKAATDAFNKAIRDFKPDGEPDQFDEAFKAYGEGADNVPNRFARELTKLQHAVEKKEYLWFPYTSAKTHYIHWGSVNCTLPTSVPAYLGLAVTSPRSDTEGNGGDLQCLPATIPDGLKDNKLKSATPVSLVSGVTYQFPDASKGPVVCSFCRLDNATSVVTIPGRTSCPGQSKLEYSGFLMTNPIKDHYSSFVCVDGNPDTEIPDVIIADDSTAPVLKVTKTWCEDCDDGDGKMMPVSCVVCSR